jgi:hypothetical protein
VQHPGKRDVVDVVAGRLGHRALLTKAGHATIDEPRIEGQQLFRAKTQPLHDARPKTLDQCVGLGGELAHHIAPGRRLHIERQASSATV